MKFTCVRYWRNAVHNNLLLLFLPHHPLLSLSLYLSLSLSLSLSLISKWALEAHQTTLLVEGNVYAQYFEDVMSTIDN